MHELALQLRQETEIEFLMHDIVVQMIAQACQRVLGAQIAKRDVRQGLIHASLRALEQEMSRHSRLVCAVSLGRQHLLRWSAVCTRPQQLHLILHSNVLQCASAHYQQSVSVTHR